MIYLCWRKTLQRIVEGDIQGTVLDLAVNFASERGLLGIALHPDFPNNPGVYLFWTESSTGDDTNVLSQTSLLGNRVDRFVWNGSNLSFDQNLIRLRAIQADADQPERGNHNGGILRFGPDGKLYIFVGDVGRRGQLQNLPCGPTADCPGSVVPDVSLADQNRMMPTLPELSLGSTMMAALHLITHFSMQARLLVER